MNLSLTDSPAFLHARLSGEFSLEEAERTFLEILQAVERRDSTRVLVDGRGVTGKPTIAERFYYGEFVARSVIKLCRKTKRPLPKFSYVLLEPVLDKHRLGETVAVNRGMNLKTFTDFDDAAKWLTA
jgi:hypothetical protein